MLDVTLIRTHPDQVRAALRKRAADPDIPAFLTLDTAFREARTTVERLRADRRRISTEIAALRREGTAAGEDRAAVLPPTEELHATAKALADELAQAEARLVELGVRHQEFLDALPNLPDDDVVAGGKECNQVVRTVGVPPVLGFPGRDHVRLAQELGLVDHQRGTALGGRGYWVYRGEGAALEWALLSHFLDAHRKAGYEFVLPPHLLTYEAG
ncbi:hypothetical protein AB0C70_43150 [Streptomyces sp. NPDC048564]|uniref:hypothetical protein n=1 Tax=Streptomyces sp. NPDC048564 TaxID=3155760 RepID=UPI00341C3D99